MTENFAPKLDFLVIGAQKCGTSWLHARLRDQRGVFLPTDKDFEFLSYSGHLGDPQWRAAFSDRFAQAPADALLGDTCASYLWTTDPRPPGFNPALPSTARDLFGPALKVVVVVRDPVERAVSAYLHHLTHGSLDWNCPLPDAPSELGLLELGRYGAQVADWAECLGADKVRVLPAPSEAQPADVMALACEFLGQRPPDTVNAETVYPGLQRRRDSEGGVWVSPEGPWTENHTRLTRAVSIQRRDDRPWVQVIHPLERVSARARLRDDTRAFARWLDAHGQRHPAMNAWLPEP